MNYHSSVTLGTSDTHVDLLISTGLWLEWLEEGPEGSGWKDRGSDSVEFIGSR